MTHCTVALLTDFGTEDGYVGAMKGRILSEAPHAQVLDISHDIESFNVRQAAFCLNNCYSYFPERTIFVVVVDPGVGTERKGLFIHTAYYDFIGPDNGVFSFVFNHEACRVYEIAIRKIPWKISPTFHGRDVFAPLAALVAKGENIKKYLHPLKNPLSFVQPVYKISEGRIRVPIIHIDHFGNIILNFSRRDFIELGRTKNLKVRLKNIVIEGIRETFGKVPKGEILLVWDSSDFLQISLNGGSAAVKLGISLEDEVEILL